MCVGVYVCMRMGVWVYAYRGVCVYVCMGVCVYVCMCVRYRCMSGCIGNALLLAAINERVNQNRQKRVDENTCAGAHTHTHTHTTHTHRQT